MKIIKAKRSKVRKVRCQGCRELAPSYETINCGSMEAGYKNLCGQCFNDEASRALGLEKFQHIRLEPVQLVDSTGQTHEFHFRSRLFGPGISLESFELRDGDPSGYQFQIIGDPEEDLLALFGRLLQKIRRGLAVKHLTREEGRLDFAKDWLAKGQIGWDEYSEGTPLLVIDGQEVTWDELGRMLMSFEGFQFKLEVRDSSDEL